MNTPALAGPPGPPEPAVLAELAELAATAASAAGELLVAAMHGARSEVTTKSTPTDMVTEMDRAAEELIVARILAQRPGDRVVAEEGTERAGASGVRWIVDPLDGTTNYLYRHPGFSVSVAAEVGGAVVAGAVVDPILGQTFTATLGGGARLDGAPIRCRAEDDLAKALVATGFSYDPARRRRQAEVLVHVLPAVRDIRRVGAAATDLCSVACGRVDGYYERGLAPWDLAAGALIAAEAGAVVCDLDGGAPSGQFVLAATPGIAEGLRRLLAGAGAGAA